jgi:protein-S-isoprenylcysteine O-methyltransferase Ste14
MLRLLRSPGGLLDADVFEKAVLTVAFSYFAARMIGSYLETRTAINLLFLANEACVVAFILLRRRTADISRRPADWLIGFGGTFLPLLLVPPGGHPLLPAAFCNMLLLIGFATHLAAKLTLRRSFGVIAANRGVKLSGPYRIVRHPMYAGYMLTQAALLLSGPSLHNCVLVACCWALQIARILAEERVLGADERYRDLMQATPYRLVPGVF